MFLRSSNVSNPVSWYSFAILHNFVAPVIILNASIWIFSTACLSSLLQLSPHTMPLYSRTGHMKDIYIRSKDFLSSRNLNDLNMLMRCQPFPVMVTMWVCQPQSLEKTRPK